MALGCFSLGVAIGWRDHGVDDQSMAVLYQRVAHKAQFVGRLALAKQPAVGVSAGLVRLVAAWLASEVAAIAIVLAVFAHKALVARPGLNQGAVHAEVILG